MPSPILPCRNKASDGLSYPISDKIWIGTKGNLCKSYINYELIDNASDCEKASLPGGFTFVNEIDDDVKDWPRGCYVDSNLRFFFIDNKVDQKDFTLYFNEIQLTASPVCWKGK